MPIKYETSDGEMVTIPDQINPYEVLEIAPSSSPSATKNALRKQLAKSKRQDRAVASVAYHMITSPNRYWKKESTYDIRDADVFVWTSMGNTQKVSEAISNSISLVHAKDERNRTIMYLAARGGFGDIVELMIQREADINGTQNNGSTPLHAAAYYGQEEIVKMLLVYGADPTLKNNSRHTPSSESTGNIKRVFHDYQTDPLGTVVQYFGSTSLTEKCIPIAYKGKVVGFEIFRSHSLRDTGTIDRWYRTIRKDWKTAYHGTKLKFVRAILTNGLLPGGTKFPNRTVVPTVTQTVPVGRTNWTKTLLVSPSILCATYSAYSQFSGVNDSRCYAVVKVYANPSKYEEFTSPTEQPAEEAIAAGGQSRLASPLRGSRETLTDGLPVWIIKDIQFDREEYERNVVVASILLMDLNFRQNIRKLGLSSSDLQELFETKF